MTAPETLATERLLLQRRRIDDAAAIFTTYAQDRDVTRYLTWRPHASLDETRGYLTAHEHVWEAGTEFTWAIRSHAGEHMGAIAFRPALFKAEVGYLIARPFWGRGYATEALCCVIEWAFTQPCLFRVWAVCNVDNHASARVMEKAGMTREGLLKRWTMHPNVSSDPSDSLCYAIVRDA